MTADQPVLHTERLTLVPLTGAHLEAAVELDADPEVLKHLGGRALTRAEAEAAHERRLAAAGEGLGYWAGLAGTGFVGWWLLRPPHGPDQPPVAGEADLGFRLRRDRWRRGYAVEGARRLIRYGFADLGLDRVFAQTAAGNTASRATMAAAGLTFVREFASGGDGDTEVEYEIKRSGR
ncbi:GNAT family N-acetyltransferase [Amycolatopsis sp. OK19-0408]|uniref:GNAT family N-acetyltransferase n=1 Tax=Amycolatopsis iheyensis TaxID=2945988 RepID=A0A9X2SJ18_9PSEU|nr:GNAT family N-acetyltransferase [Amycolatopsis iheyensis]MCR6482381.1 GNAT family N-acetyltransferase [Amycolatopsis iheyensis]